MSSVSGRKPKARRASSSKGKTRQETYRFPKWLLTERFTIRHTPLSQHFFTVTIFGQTESPGAFDGHSTSIAAAAKIAFKLRHAAKYAP